MKLKLNKETKAGILVLLTLAVFIWGYSFLSGRNIFSATHSYYVQYDRIGGMMEQADVKLSGYNVGYVSSIRFVGIDDFLVRLSVESRFSLPEGTVARIISSDIMGTRAIELVPGPLPGIHSPGDTLAGEIEPDLVAEITNYLVPLASRAENMMASMDSVLIVFQTLLDQDFQDTFSQSIDRIGSTIVSLQSSVHSIDTLFSHEESRFNRIMDNMESISDNLAGNNQNITTILDNFASVSDSLARLEIIAAVNNLNDVLSETTRIIEGIERGEGSLGKLVSDEQLYNNLENATRNLDMLLIDLRERPGRYLNFSIFGRRRD